MKARSSGVALCRSRFVLRTPDLVQEEPAVLLLVEVVLEVALVPARRLDEVQQELPELLGVSGPGGQESVERNGHGCGRSRRHATDVRM